MQGLYLGILGRNAVFGELSAWVPHIGAYEIVAEPNWSDVAFGYRLLTDNFPDGLGHSMVESDPYGRAAVTMAVGYLAASAGVMIGVGGTVVQANWGVIGGAIQTGALVTALGGAFSVGIGLVLIGVGLYIFGGLVPRILSGNYPSAFGTASPSFQNWGVVRNLDGSTMSNRTLDSWVPPPNYTGEWWHTDSDAGVDNPSGASGWFLEF